MAGNGCVIVIFFGMNRKECISICRRWSTTGSALLAMLALLLINSASDKLKCTGASQSVVFIFSNFSFFQNLPFMKKLFLFLFIPLSILFSCNSDAVNEQGEKVSYELAKKELLKKEQKDPAAFLMVNGNDKRNILGQTVVKGTITSKAKVAVYKDVNLQLSFYSKTRALLETDKETIFEVWHPGEAKNFKTKYFTPKGTDSVSLKVSSAKIVTVEGSPSSN